MKQIKLNTNTRQSGKTYRLIGKYLKFVSKKDKVLYLAFNKQAKKIVKRRINSVNSTFIPEVVTFQEFDNNIIKHLTTLDVIIIDDWSYYNNIDHLKKLIETVFKGRIRLRGETTFSDL